MVCRSLSRACRIIKRQCGMVKSVMLSDRLTFGSSSSTSGSSSTTRYKPVRSKKQANGGGGGVNSHHHQSSPPCDRCSTAAIDILILLVALAACAFLFTPYFKLVCNEIIEILPATFLFIGEVVYEAPVAYALAAVLTSASVIGMWELYQFKSRKCGNPSCKGLKNAMECDIQLETEECVKSSPPTNAVLLDKGLQLAQDQKELEAELKRMAPPNGRAVLVFRARCGCPAARFEVWGSKRPRRSKK
ncbi:uncharacterized protein At5g19025 [Selaginella moellendorffii]|nr:uncharacterized protein At5g19025 [Selaginella moellendorffii]XP_024543032.1 uncharacterized protein At5g19025 [Selaginella moellendorffii]|eukprot:XP_002982225.2 uncharacterized protein At5g19025 [Selaginella moellendorffii]